MSSMSKTPAQKAEAKIRMRDRRKDPEYRKQRNARSKIRNANPRRAQYASGKHSVVTYLIQDEHGRGKIGSTVNLRYRLMLLQCGNADLLSVVGVIPGNCELDLQTQFVAHKIRNEWFQLDRAISLAFAL